MEVVGTAFTSGMDGHLAKLYSIIDNLRMEVLTLKPTVSSLVEENKKLGEDRRRVPDPKKQQTILPETPRLCKTQGFHL
jgi:hypothetical protein